jgi:hypothetical protein
MDNVVKLARLPNRVHTKDELLSIVAQIDFENIVVIIEDAEGITTMVIDGTTAERMNWMLDRAKFRLHRAD